MTLQGLFDKPLGHLLEKWKSLEKGGMVTHGVLAIGSLASAFLLSGGTASFLPFIREVLLMLGMSAFPLSDGLHEEDIRKVLEEQFRRLGSDKQALARTGLSDDDLEKIMMVVEAGREKNEEALNELVKPLMEALGDQFTELKEYLPAQLKPRFDNLDNSLKELIGRTKKIERKLFGDEETDREIVIGTSGSSGPRAIGVIGRDSEVEEYTRGFISGKFRGEEFKVIWLWGLGGIGKSTLASLVYSELADRSSGSTPFKRFIWCNIRELPDPATVAAEMTGRLSRKGGAPSAAGEPATTRSFDTALADGRQDTEANRKQARKREFNRNLDFLCTNLANEPAFVVFDNIESAMSEDEGTGMFPEEEGKPGWYDLLGAMLKTRSAFIVTSRPEPYFSESGCAVVEISGLGRDGAVKLLKSRGLKDNDDVLEEAYRLFGGHPMALTALAAEVSRHKEWKGHLAKDREIMDVVRRSSDRRQNPFLLFEKIVDQLPPSAFKTLTAISFLHRPESKSVIAALVHPEIESGEVSDILEDLNKRSLLQIDIVSDPTLYSLHKIVEDVCRRKVKADDVRSIHQRACDHYTGMKEGKNVASIDQARHLLEAVKHAHEIKDLTRSDTVLYGDIDLAHKLATWGRFDLALPIHRQQLAIAEEQGRPRDTMFAAEAAGQASGSLGNYQEAEDFLQKALKVAEEIGDKVEQCGIHGDLGQVLWRHGNEKEAFEHVKTALQLAGSEIKDSHEEAYWLGALGQLHMSLYEFDEAMQQFDKTLEICKKEGDRYNVGVINGSVGYVHFMQGKLEEALDRFGQALDSAREIGDHVGMNTWAELVVETHRRRRDLRKALEELGRLRSIECVSDADALDSYMRIAGDCDRDELYAEAARAYLEAAPLAEKVYSNDHPKLESFTVKAGQALLWTNNLHKAGEFLDRALILAGRNRNDKNVAKVLGLIGEMESWSGHYEEAIRELKRSLDIPEEAKDLHTAGYPNLLIAESLYNLGNHKEALEHIDVAMGYAEKEKADWMIGFCDGAKSLVFLAQGKMDDALDLAQRSVTCARKENIRLNLGVALERLGTVRRERGEYKLAFDNYQESIEIAAAVDQRPNEAWSRMELGKLYMATHEPEKARAEFEKAESTYKALDLPRLADQASRHLEEAQKTRMETSKPDAPGQSPQ